MNQSMPDSPNMPTIEWNPIYGPYIFWKTMHQALLELGYEPQRVLALYGLDTNQPQVNILNTYALHVASAEATDVAIGCITANPALKVIIFTDGSQLYNTGLSRLLAACASNHNVTVVVMHQSADYSLSSRGLSAVVSAGCTFVARSFVGDPNQLKSVFKAASKHDGLSVMDVLIPPSLNQHSTYAAWRAKAFRLQDANQPKSAHWPANDPTKAMQLLVQESARLDIGVFYKRVTPSYETRLLAKTAIPLVDQPVKSVSIKKILSTLK